MHKPDARALSSPDPAGLLAIAAAAALWAVAATAARGLFDRGVDPLSLAASRSIVAMLGLALLPAAWNRPQETRTLSVVALGLSIAGVNSVYYLAIERLDVAVALVLQYTAPALVVAWAAFVLRRAPGRDVLAALAATFVGVVLVSDVGAGIGDVNALGIAFGLASAVLFATYTLLSEKAGEHYGIIGALFRGFVAATVLWTMLFWARGFPSELIESENLPTVLFIGLAGTLSPFLLFLWGVQRVRSERAAIAATLEPIVAAVVAWIWLGQGLSIVQMIGGAIILGAVASLQVRHRRIAAPAPEP
jgi:DME family drug/metabolite transporter